MKIAILSDSSCTKNEFKNRNGFTYVPLMITLPDGSQLSDDDDLDVDRFYKELDKSALKTSLTPPGVMTQQWDKLLQEYDQVVVLLLSKGLSGQYNAARLLSLDEPYENKVFVVDTNGVSIVLDELIERALTMAEDGKTGAEIKQEIENLNESFLTFIIPKSLDQLVRGGRISKAAAGLAKVLKITPILKYNGEIDKEGKARTFKKAINDAINLLMERVDDVKTIDVAYSKTEEDNIELVKNAIEEHGLKINKFHELSNVITAHTGRHTFALSVWNK
jgi:DegV family protein with EDD domain